LIPKAKPEQAETANWRQYSEKQPMWRPNTGPVPINTASRGGPKAVHSGLQKRRLDNALDADGTSVQIMLVQYINSWILGQRLLKF